MRGGWKGRSKNAKNTSENCTKGSYHESRRVRRLEKIFGSIKTDGVANTSEDLLRERLERET